MALTASVSLRTAAATLCAGGCIVFSSPATAANWDFSPGVTLSATYSDNLTLAPTGTTVSDTIYEVSPSLRLERDGSKWDMTAAYTLQGLSYQEADDSTQIFHFLDLNSTLVAVEDTLGVTLNSNISQQIVNPEQGVGFSTASRSRNLNEVATLGIEPWYTFRLGDFSGGRLSYRAGVVEYDDVEQFDSTSGRTALQLFSEPPQAKWNAALNISDTQAEYDTGDDISLQSIGLDLGYALTPRADAIVSLGEDNNDFGNVAIPGDIDGTFWSLGVRGTIGALSRYELRAGEQFFGDSYFVSYERDGRRLSTRLSYDEETTTVGAAQLDYENVLGFLNQAGIDVSGIELPESTPDVYIRKRLTFTNTYKLAKSSWQLSLFDESRDYLGAAVADESDGIVGFALLWTWQPANRTDLSIGGNWQKLDLRTDNNEPEDFRMQATLARQISRSTNLSLKVLHSQRSATRDINEYEENAITVAFRYDF